MGRHPARLVLVAALVGFALSGGGCGHSVTPTDDFRDPESIPLPEDLTAFPSANGINLNWVAEDRIFAFIDGWNIYRAVGPAFPDDGAYVRINEELFLEQMFVDTDVENGILYWYRLTSVSPANIESLPTGAVSALVDFTPPDPPTGLRASPTPNSVRLQWDVSSDPRLEHYNVYRTPPDPPLVFGPIPPGLPDFLDDDLQPGQTLRYWVTAVDLSLNESAPSETVTVTVPAPTMEMLPGSRATGRIGAS